MKIALDPQIHADLSIPEGPLLKLFFQSRQSAWLMPS
jgi:hypothetical protein